MKNRIFYALLCFGLGGISLSIWMLLSISVSQKYELADPADCISAVTGNDLCLREDIFITTLIISGILMMFSMYKLALDIRKK